MAVQVRRFASTLLVIGIANAVVLKTAPRSSAVSGSELLSVKEQAVEGSQRGSFPKDEDFFREDAEKMDELPPHPTSPPKGCHPKCVWDCGGAPCQNACQPFCDPPKCETRCGKVSTKHCRRKCQDPQCAIVCPPQCAHGHCPDCKTVCNKPFCPLDCGNALCENVCADPVCTWRCKPEMGCEPKCKLRCEEAACNLDGVNKGPELPDSQMTKQLGWEVAWKGWAKVPMDRLRQEMTAKAPTGAQSPGGALAPVVARIEPPPSPPLEAAPSSDLSIPSTMIRAVAPHSRVTMPTGAMPVRMAGMASGAQPAR